MKTKADSWELVLGTYEGGLIGYRVTEKKMERMFAEHVHKNYAISSLDSTEDLLVSGSSDERIKVFSLKNNTQTHTLMGSESPVVSVNFITLQPTNQDKQKKKERKEEASPSPSKKRLRPELYVQATFEDGVCKLFRRRGDFNDVVLTTNFRQRNAEGKFKRRGPKIRGAHPNPVTANVSLVAYLDGSAALFNLEAKHAIATLPTDVAKDVHTAAWSPSGDFCCLVGPKEALLYHLASGAMTSIAPDAKTSFSCVAATDNVVFLGTDSGLIKAYSVMRGEEQDKAVLVAEEWLELNVGEMAGNAHCRLRCLQVGLTANGQQVMSSVDSQGTLFVWNLDADETKIDLLHFQETNLQVTALTLNTQVLHVLN